MNRRKMLASMSIQIASERARSEAHRIAAREPRDVHHRPSTAKSVLAYSEFAPIASRFHPAASRSGDRDVHASSSTARGAARSTRFHMRARRG
jgi:hypothetical protein